MRKTNLKKIVAMLAIVLLMVAIESSVFATSLTIPTANSTTGVKEVHSITSNILGIIQAIAMGVAVVMLVVLAIKYFSSSAEGKAEVKKQAMAYVIGAVLLFGGTGILEILKSVGGTIGKTTVTTSVEIVRSIDMNA